MDGYWSDALQRRIDRRRALRALSGGSIAAAVLAACGGGSRDSKQARDRSGLLSEPEDTSKRATRGGVWQTSRTDDATTLDPISNISSLSWTDMLQVYSHLTRAGLRSDQPDAFEGDAAQSWEFAPEGSQVTFKLRPNLKLDSRAPTSGRTMTSADVKASFDRFAETSPYRAEVFNSLSEAAPVQSVTAPDDQTVVIKLAFPYGSIIEMVGFAYYLYILPAEASGERFNVKSEMRGSGPFRLKSYTPSVALEYERNPEWYLKDRPHLDGIRRTIVPDYSAGLSQFEAGALWNFAVRQEDVLRVKREHMAMVMLQDRDIGTASLASTPYTAFSKRPDSPLADVRLRRAASMLIDRDAMIATLNNTDVFAREGLPAETLWNAHIPTKSPNWIDPRDSAIGEGRKYFQHNPAEARKLIDATGMKTVDLPYFYQNRPADARENEIIVAMLQEGASFTLDARTLDYNTEWREVCQRSAGQAYTGFCKNNSGGFNEDAYLVAKYTPNGKYSASYLPIPGITDAVLAARKEVDARRRGELVKDIVRKLALEMPDLPQAGRSYQFSLRWPWLKNHGVFVTGGASALEFTEYWYDASART